MIWGAILKGKKLPLVFVNTTMNSPKYCDLLNSFIKTHFSKEERDFLTFQQDNAPCHRAKNTKKWLDENNIDVMDWP